MARKKSEFTQEQEEVNVIIEEVKVEKKTALERKDLYQLRFLIEKKRVKELEIEGMRKDLKIKQLEINVQEIQIQRLKDNLGKIATDIEEKKKIIDIAMDEFAACRDRIAAEYGIEGKWGYDENSGKIILIPEK